MILPDVFCQRYYNEFVASKPRNQDYGTIYCFIHDKIQSNEINQENIELLFNEYSGNIEYIRVFNLMFPCCYILDYKNQFVTIAMMMKFKELRVEE